VNNSHGGNPEVQKHMGEPEHVMWAIERPDGGRGFGFTGAHHHKNWGNDDFRKIVLNAIVWTAHIEVPPNGIEANVTLEHLQQKLDPNGPKKAAKKPTPPANFPKPKYASGIIQS